MKMNKKALRTFASTNPAPAMSPSHGLLHTTQVEYIIRTAVKIIDHRRMLILYVYPRAQAVQGDFAPLWTMFQGKDDYITLARRPDGTTYWRKASFERLSDDYYFTLKCAFYSGKDQERVSRYFRSDAPGLKPLLWAQGTILWNRQKKRERERDKIVRARMKCLPSLPRGLATWAHQNVMPAYFFYHHAKHGKATGICSSCGQEASLTEVKHNAKGVCPHCGREVTMKPRGRIGRLYDRETFQILQRAKTGELAVRIMKATCAYYGDHPGTVVYESARQFVSLDESGAIHCDRYYYAHSSEKWKQGDRPELYPYQYNFEGDTCGHVYCGNLPKALRGTPWQYCPVQQFYEHSHAPMRMYPFLLAHLEHPKLEHLVKVGFYDLVTVNANLKLSIFAETKCHFSSVGIVVYTALFHNFTCRYEACQALIYQPVLGLTGENGKYNYSRAAHVYPPFSDITRSAKNYKIALALTRGLTVQTTKKDRLRDARAPLGAPSLKRSFNNA